MYNIIIEKLVIDKIDNFIEYDLNSFLSLIEDSWIDNIYLIEENYIKISAEFSEKILFSIKNNFKEDIISKKLEKEDIFSLIFSVWNYRLFLKFREDINKKIRFINDIEFFKK